MPKILRKLLKSLLAIFAVCFLGLVFSPLVSLVLPEKLTNRTYYRLLYKVIADKETTGCKNEEEKTLKIFHYVVDHTFLQGVPQKAKPAESLIYGEAYCDYQARVLNALLGAAGINGRYIVLFDKTGISPHTSAEVFLAGKWRVFDSSLNIIFQDKAGNRLSLEELSANPDLIFEQKKLIAWKDYAPEDYETKSSGLKSMFPLVSQPLRSIPVNSQAHILDRIADLYFRLFKYPFFDFYQNVYLTLKKPFAPEDFRLFFKARNYHLAYRYSLALKHYDSLIAKYPESKYTEDAVFFRGILYFDHQEYSKAIEALNLFTDKDSKFSSKWKNAAYFYLGRIHEQEGRHEESLNVYQHADVLKLSAEVMEEINQRRQ